MLTEQNVSVRELARRMQPGDPEGMRRSVARWLSPTANAVNPSPASRKAVAQALGLPEDVFGDEGDDSEETDPVAALMTAIRRVVRDEIRSVA